MTGRFVAGGRPRHATHCDHCQKASYVSRDHARQVAKAWRNNDLRPYRCPVSDYWHLGHLTRAVKRGKITRDQAYGGGQ